MKSSSDYKVTSAFACLLVGEPKSGKTNIAMAFPDPWFLDLDDNLASAVRRSNNKKFYYDSVKEIDPALQYEAALKLVAAAAADPQVKTLVLDSLTSFSSLVINHILGGLRKAGLASKLRTDTLDEQIRLVDYQTVSTLTLKMVAQFRASGKYVLWSSHQKIDKDELTGRIRYKLHMPGNLSENLGAYFTDVWGTEVQPTVTPSGPGAKFLIRTKPTGMHVSLGASFPVDASIDITDKLPDQIWQLLAPKLGATTK